MTDPIIKAAEVRRANEALAHCSRCREFARALEKVGVDQSDRYGRLDARENLAKGIIEVAAALNAQSDNG